MARNSKNIDSQRPESNVSRAVDACVRKCAQVDAGVALSCNQREQRKADDEHEPQEAGVGGRDPAG